MCGAVPISDFVYAYVFTVLMYVHTFEILFIEASEHILQTTQNIYSIKLLRIIVEWEKKKDKNKEITTQKRARSTSSSWSCHKFCRMAFVSSHDIVLCDIRGVCACVNFRLLQWMSLKRGFVSSLCTGTSALQWMKLIEGLRVITQVYPIFSMT